MQFNVFKYFFSGWGAMADASGIQSSMPNSAPIKGATLTSPDAAMQIATVYACVRLLASTIACLPIEVFIKDSDGNKKPDRECNLAYILGTSPNYAMSPYDFWQTMTMHWALRGNAYALITRNSLGEIVSLIPLNPDQMKVTLEKGRVHYYYQKNDQPLIEYKNSDVLHWKDVGNGYIGLSKLEYMRASVNEGYHCQENALELFSKNGMTNGMIVADQNLNKMQQKDVGIAFKEAREKGLIPVLPSSMHFQSLALSPADTQLLQTRQFSVEEICRWFGVPSALINSNGGASGANIEQVTSNFYKTTILPMCTSIEQTIMKKLASNDLRHTHEVKFKLSELYKANDKDRYSIYAQAVQNGIMTRNEVRRQEGLARYEGGDELTVQTNLSPLHMLGTQNPSQEPQKPLSTEPIKQ